MKLKTHKAKLTPNFYRELEKKIQRGELQDCLSTVVQQLEEQGLSRGEAIFIAARRFPKQYSRDRRLGWERSRFNLSFPRGYARPASAKTLFKFIGA